MSGRQDCGGVGGGAGGCWTNPAHRKWFLIIADQQTLAEIPRRNRMGGNGECERE